MPLIKNKKKENEELNQKLLLQQRYSQRITLARAGREAFLEKKYVLASKHYHEYLMILAERYNKANYYQLGPEVFNPEKEMTEMILVSQVFWDMARIYEMTPKLSQAFHKCLNQFVRFTINQQYQVLNAEMLRKYIRKNKRRSRQIQSLEKAYSQIFIESKKCFIATHSLGSEHFATQDLRLFKSFLQKYLFGRKFIELYYRHSSPLVNYLDKKPLYSRIFKYFSAPILIAFSKLVKPFTI